MAGNPPGYNFTRTEWAKDFLARIGAPVSPENVIAVVAWEMAEGGHFVNNARFNPLNTTQDAPGAKPINSVGVKSYPDYQTGMTATVQTVDNGRYSAIIAALRASSPAAETAAAVDGSVWGTKEAHTTVDTARKDVGAGGGTFTGDQGPGAVPGGGPAGVLFAGPGSDYLRGITDPLTGLVSLLARVGAWIGNRRNWARILQIVLGVIGLVVGVTLLNGGPSTIGKALPL